MKPDCSFSDEEIQAAIDSAVISKSRLSVDKCDTFDLSKEFDNVRNVLSKRVQEIRSRI